jgi:hypothetical protein
MVYASVVDAADELLYNVQNSCTSIPNSAIFPRFRHSIPFQAEGCVALQGQTFEHLL